MLFACLVGIASAEPEREPAQKPAQQPEKKPRPKRGIVKVVDAAGKTIDDVEFMYRFRSPRAAVAAGCEVQVMADGSYRVLRHEMDTASGHGTHVLTLSHKFWGVKRVSWQPGSPEPLVVTMLRPATVTVEVANAADSPHRRHLGVVVQEANVPDEQRLVPDNVSKEGVARIARVQPGDCEVLLGVALDSFVGRSPPKGGRFSGVMFVAALAKAKIKSGSANKVRIELPKLYPLTVKGKPGKRHYIQPENRWGSTSIHYINLDDKGHFKFERLPAGRYTLTGLKNGMSTKIPFEVPAKTPLVLPKDFG